MTTQPESADHGLLISEVFGPTVQGEGRSTGQRCAFVRLGACNLHCSWCDTPYTWDGGRYDLRSELHREPTAGILQQIADMAVPLVVISGGEPLLQQRFPAFKQLVRGILLDLGADVEFETNGTIAPEDWLARRFGVRFNVSPKLAHNGDPERLRIRPAALQRFSELTFDRRASFKFVVRHDSHRVRDLDVAQVRWFVEQFRIPTSAVWIMPEGTTAERVLSGTQRLADTVVAEGWNLTTRLHTLVWGSERGR